MVALFASSARLPEAWANDVRFEIGRNGTIEAIMTGASAAGAEKILGPVIPGMPNLHSHAFQRAFAGLAEKRSADGDDFWAWREAMYRFLAVLSPDDVEIIATLLYIELAKAGYSRVCEFHYLHNDTHGRRYPEPQAMARAHLRAAKMAGIGITLVPTLYTSGGFGGKPLSDRQRRFAISVDEFVAMVKGLEDEVQSEPNASVALGIHSLRGTRENEIEQVLIVLPDRSIHIHVSEQQREVDECVAWCGKAPIAQLHHRFGLDKRWNLIHATHATPEEIALIAGSGATVTLCPSTEGNLGDGFFPADAYFRHGGVFGIGSDSHVTLDPREELRLFEYGRRLQAQKRTLSADERMPHVGAWLWLHAAQGGEQASAAPVGKLHKGYRADFVVLDGEAPGMLGREGDQLLDGFVFAAGAGAIRETWIGGQRLAAQSRHPGEAEAREKFRRAMQRWQGAP